MADAFYYDRELRTGFCLLGRISNGECRVCG